MSNKNRSLVVHGPQASGKSRYADAIAKHFGLSQVVHELHDNQVLNDYDTLYLSRSPVDGMHNMSIKGAIELVRPGLNIVTVINGVPYGEGFNNGPVPSLDWGQSVADTIEPLPVGEVTEVPLHTMINNAFCTFNIGVLWRFDKLEESDNETQRAIKIIGNLSRMSCAVKDYAERQQATKDRLATYENWLDMFGSFMHEVKERRF